MLEPTEAWTVLEYATAAEKAIRDISARGKLPVLCGGTNYYVQSVLWNSTMGEVEGPAGVTGDDRASDEEVDGAAAYQRLQQVDPVMADRLHPSNIRKVLRSLQIFDSTGCRMSDLIERQKAENAKAAPRYDVCMLWCDAELGALNDRLDSRV